MSGQDPVNASAVTASLEWIEKIQLHQPGWLFLFLFILLGLFAWIRTYYGNILMQTLQASASFQVASRMFMDNSLLQKQLDNVLYGLYFLSAGLLLYIAEIRFKLFPYGITGAWLYLFNLGLLTGIFLGRIVMVNLAGLMFNKLRIFREYLYNIFIFQ